MAGKIWEVNDQALVILEHFAENSEETVLADHGMLLWGNMNYNYNEATMGYIPGSDFSGVSYLSRNWDHPHLIGYMESHDEERLMFKNLRWGNSNAGYDIKQISTALKRMELAAAFYFTVPGPKMIWQFGELGYDYSINHCPDGTIDEECRTAGKPVRWDYYDDWRRRRLFDIYAMLIDLKKTEPIFGTDDFSTSFGGAIKSVHLNHPDYNVTVLGNFGVTGGTIAPGFQRTGTWYEYFSRESIDVSDVNMIINLKPGEYRLYSTVEFQDHGITLSAPVIQPADKHHVSLYPNPSQGEINISFELQEKQNVTVYLYNIQGQKISVLMDQILLPDSYIIFWNRNLVPGNVAAGVYLVEITIGGKKIIKRVVLH